MGLKWKSVLRGVGVGAVAYAVIVGGLIAFGTAKPPKPAPAISNPFALIDTAGLPGILKYRARDGALLSYRDYRASETRIAVLLHGSAGSSIDLHPLALALQAAGISALVPDLRGHGANRPHGDIVYVGQMDDDLEDLIAERRRTQPDIRCTIVGFSSGAAFALRFAAEVPAGRLAEDYVLVSPYLRYDAPSVRASKPGAAVSQTWAAASVPRMVGLTIANKWGIHAWDGLPVLVFPVRADIEEATNAYSWRLYKNFAGDDDYLEEIRRAAGPLQVLVGGSDELLDARALASEFRSQRSGIPVSIIAGMGHSDMVTKPGAIAAVVAVVTEPR